MSLRTADKGAPKRWLTTLLGSKMKETHLLKQLPTFALDLNSFSLYIIVSMICMIYQSLTIPKRLNTLYEKSKTTMNRELWRLIIIVIFIRIS